MRRLLWCVLLVIPSSILAQGDCFPPDDSNEAKTFAIFAVPFAFAPATAPAPMEAWTARIALEASYLPNVDDETATPTVCRPGKGPENTDFGSLVPRPRVILVLPGGIGLEVSWIPPVRVRDAEPNLFGFALGKNFRLGEGGMVLGLRLHATTGSIHAPITCDEAALQDSNSECFNGTRSNDKFQPNAFGAEAAVGWSLGGGRVQPFLGAGVNLLRPRFQVNFTNQFGQLDNRRVEVDLKRAALFAGASWYPVPRLGITGQIYSAPSDAVTGRVTVSYGLSN